MPFTEAVHAGDYRRYVGVCGAQMGKTDSVLDLIGARLDQRPAPIIYVGPTREFLTDQFEPRLMALLDEAASLQNKVSRGRVMKKTLKLIAGVRVRLAHAGSSTALKSDPAALAFIDEYDEMMGSVKGQGDVLGLVEARGETYSDFATVATSTPSTGLVTTEVDPVSGLEFWAVTIGEDITSPIWKLWQEGTRYHWAWPCLHCNEYFIPRFSCLKWPDGSTPIQARRSAFVACPRCGGVHTEENKPELNARGLYVAPGQKVVAGEVVGDPPETSTFSVWVSGLASPFVSFGQRAETYLTAYISGDPERVQTAINAGMGELYSMSASGDVPEWQEILDRRIKYYKPRTLPPDAIKLVMGVDVQKLSLIYVIRAFGARGTSWLVDYGMIHGPTDDDDVWTRLADKMLDPIGGLYIEKVMIDSGFRPNKRDAGGEHKVYEFCRRYRWLCHPTKGKDVQNPPYRVSKIEVKPDGKKLTYSLDLVWLSTDFFKSLLFSRIRTPLDQPGAFHVHEEVEEDYAKQLVSEVRIIDRATGKPVWLKRARDNHFLDCEALCAAAAYALNVQRIPEGISRDPLSASTPQDGDDALPGPPPVLAPPQSGGGMNLRNRFSGMSARVNR